VTNPEKIQENKYEEYSEEKIKASVNGIYNRFVKRIIDLVIALCLGILLIPFYIVISVIIVIDDGFPILYRAKRGGYHNTVFKICKFRTMVKNADKIGGATTGLNDKRITKSGAFLRKSKFDETAQLLNIIKGDMSFIGPRPEALQYVERFKGLEKYILEVRPGITDYSSLKFINLDEIVGSENVDEVFETKVLGKKNILRVKYVSEISFTTDVKIFFSTIKGVLKKIMRTLSRTQK